MESTAETDALCVRCGLCCDGTLFSFLRVDADEAGAFALPIVEQDAGRHVLPLPCVALSGTRCGVFPRRPRGCARFDCKLLVALRDRAVHLDEALALVAEARARAAAVPELAAAREAPGVLSRDARAALRALEDFLDGRFRW